MLEAVHWKFAFYFPVFKVKQLLNYHPNLLEDVNIVRTHTPLHLAARNGHMNVVSYFLSCGMDVNITVSLLAGDSYLRLEQFAIK